MPNQNRGIRMLKTVALLLALTCLLVLAGCGNKKSSSPSGVKAEESSRSVAEPAVESFQYKEDAALYKGDTAGIQREGFVNVSEQKIDTLQSAIERAGRECTVEYDAVRVYYDDTASIWKVVFYVSGTVGGDQSIYLNSSGITQLIVYGE